MIFSILPLGNVILGKSYDEKMSKDVKLKLDEISIEVMEFLGV